MNKYEYLLQQTEEALTKSESPMVAKIQKKHFEIRLLTLESDAETAKKKLQRLVAAKELDFKAIYNAKNEEQLAMREFQTMTTIYNELFNTKVDENGNVLGQDLASGPAAM